MIKMDTANFNFNLERDMIEKDDQYRNRQIFSLPVRMENWNEDLFLREEKNRLTNMKRIRCELLVEKTRAMLRNLLKPVALAKERPFVEYGRWYQLKANAIPSTIKPCGKYGLYLSGLIDERDIDYGTHFMHGCGLTASPDRLPCIRNTFIFRGCERDKNEECVNYGDDVYIEICESGICTPLYIQCENATHDNFGSHLIPRLTQSPDLYCRFKLLHWQPQFRYETEGSCFAPESTVIIQHTASGRNLAVEYNRWIPTFFGPECTVTCHTFQDSHRMETAENMWQICQTKRADRNLYVRAAKGEDIPAELLE